MLTVDVAGQHNTSVLALGPGSWMGGFAIFVEVSASFALLFFFWLALCQLNSKICLIIIKCLVIKNKLSSWQPTNLMYN